MSWYRIGTVAVTNGSKTVTGVGTLFTTAVNAGDAFALVDANLNPTGAWYEVESVTNNTTLVLKQSYAGSTGSNNQYCVFNMVGNMTTPSFAQRLATFFASFQSLIDKPTTTPTASSIPIADSGGKIADGWIPATVARLESPALTGSPTAPTQAASDDSTKIATTAYVKSQVASDTVAGMVELATSAEVLAGTDTQRGITPATLTAKILGTVSQSGGVPTGAVIERGSNANGSYVKFADGTMIAWGSASWAGTASYPLTLDLPAVYSASPNAFLTPARSSSSVIMIAAGEATYSKITIGVWTLTDIPSFALRGSAMNYKYTVIGRWF